MRVLHVINGLGGLGGGGAEQSLRVQLPALRDLGVDGEVVCLLDREGPLDEQIRAEGFPVTILAATGWVGWIRELRALVRSRRPDLVHCTIFDASLVTRLACAGLGIPVLNSLVNTSYDPTRVRDLGISPWKLRVVRTADRVTARHLVTHVHALTGAVRAEAVDVLGVDPARVTVIGRGRSAAVLRVPDEQARAAARRRLDLPADAPVVVNVGRQERQKAQPVLIEAFARVLDHHPEALLLIAGRDGAATAANHQAIAAAGIEGSVRLLGHRDDVLDVLAAADVFAFPSYYEGLGCSVIEALAVGLPVVGSDAPAIAEVLGDGRHGRLVGRGDVAALATALDELLADPRERTRLGAAGRARFLDAFELDVVAADTAALYRSLVAADAGPAPTPPPDHQPRT